MTETEKRDCYAEPGKLRVAIVLSLLVIIGVGITLRQYYLHLSMESLLEDTTLLQKEGNYEEALQVYDKVLDKDPYNTAALLDKGDLFYEISDYESAIANYNQVIKIDATNTSAYLERGRAYLENGMYENAVADFNQVLQLDSSLNVQALELRGNAYHEVGEYVLALEDYSSALTIWREIGSRADESRILYELGIVYADLGNNNEARQYLSQALEFAKEIGNIDLVSQIIDSNLLTNIVITDPNDQASFENTSEIKVSGTSHRRECKLNCVTDVPR